MKNIKKLVRDGKVAVLYSPDFGAGWYSWNPGVPEILFDPAIVEFVEHDQMAELNTYITLKYPELYTGGMKDLVVAWLVVGTEFRIKEHDGAESIERPNDIRWITA